MTYNNTEKQPKLDCEFNVVGLTYVSLYFKDFKKAIDYYSQIWGPPAFSEDGGETIGWPMGSNWLTLFPSKHGTNIDSNPSNAEFAIEVASKDDVDKMYNKFIETGAKKCMEPQDTWMYKPMRFCCVDDPFGVRIDIYCPIPKKQ